MNTTNFARRRNTASKEEIQRSFSVVTHGMRSMGLGIEFRYRVEGFRYRGEVLGDPTIQRSFPSSPSPVVEGLFWEQVMC
jgi:hypothetical protein